MNEPPAITGAGGADAYNRIEGVLEPELPGLHAYLRCLVGNAADAEDLLANLRVRVYVNWFRYDPTRALQPWLYTVARRLALDLLERQQRRGPHSSFEDELDSPSGGASEPGESALESMIKGETAERVRAAVDRLKPEWREVIILSDFLQWDRERVAEVLGIDKQVVSNRKHAGHKHLAKLLSDLAP